jgi:hypothetical protein
MYDFLSPSDPLAFLTCYANAPRVSTTPSLTDSARSEVLWASLSDRFWRPDTVQVRDQNEEFQVDGAELTALLVYTTC